MYFCTLGELNWITACNREIAIGLYLTSYFHRKRIASFYHIFFDVGIVDLVKAILYAL